jgi:hypothetical protein
VPVGSLSGQSIWKMQQSKSRRSSRIHDFDILPPEKRWTFRLPSLFSAFDPPCCHENSRGPFGVQVPPHDCKALAGNGLQASH